VRDTPSAADRQSDQGVGCKLAGATGLEPAASWLRQLCSKRTRHSRLALNAPPGSQRKMCSWPTCCAGPKPFPQSSPTELELSLASKEIWLGVAVHIRESRGRGAKTGSRGYEASGSQDELRSCFAVIFRTCRSSRIPSCASGHRRPAYEP
jgi:hypothetical protein